jgi:hypothetical protein
MQREYVVFCLDELVDWGRFGHFLHEADYLLLSLASSVEEEDITVAEAFEKLDHYLSDPGITEKVGTLKEGWSVADSWKWQEIFEKSVPDFPRYGNVLEDLPITHIFEDEANCSARELGIPDVGYFGSSGSTGEIFSVESAEALEALRKAMAGKYKIVVKKDLDEYVPFPPPSPEEAERFVEHHRERKAGRKASTASPAPFVKMR